MKRFLICCVWAAFLAGCSKHLPESDVLRLALETSPNRLDPALVVDVAEGQICSLMYQGLVRFAPSGDLVPDAAREWRVAEGGVRYEFHLDTRARFGNGVRLRSRDVEASFERVLAPESRSSRKWVLDRIRGAKRFSEGAADSIEGVSAPDDSTLVVEIEEPFRPFLELLAMPAAYIVCAEFDSAGGESPAKKRDLRLPVAGGEAGPPVGSGRWVLSRWERGDVIELAPNPFYPAAASPLRRLVFRVIPEAFTRIAEFESGTLDILRIPQAELDRVLGDPARQPFVQSRPELRVTYVGFNTRRGPLRDVRVRRALNMAVDVERIVSVLTGGHAVRSTGTIPPGLPGYVRRPAYPFDPVRARRLLADAGYPDGFEMEIWLRDSPEGNRVVEAVQGYLLETGIQVRIVKREWSAFKEAVSQGRVDAFFLDWYGDYPDGENFLYPLFHSANAGGGGNRSFFQDARVDSLVEKSQRTQDAEVCRRLYAEIDSLVYDQAPWLYLYFPTSFVVVSPAVAGYTFPAMYLGEDFSTVSKVLKGDS